MCGRFVSSSSAEDIAAYFDTEEISEKLLEPSTNVAPSSDVYVVAESGGVRRLEPMHWGLVPFWAKDLKIGNRMTNARSETIAEKSSFRNAFKKRRCIVPADGFYEWKKVPGQTKKQPYFVHRPDNEMYAFAGLWEVWKPKDAEGRETGEELHSCTIITGDANEKMSEIHHRQPIMLPPDAWSTWLDDQNHDTDTLGQLLVPAPNSLTAFHPVSPEVNNARNKATDLPSEVEPELENAAARVGAAGDGAE